MIMLNLVASLGQRTLVFMQGIGAFSIFVFQTVSSLVRPPIYLNSLFRQFVSIGFYSLPVVAMTAFFSGAVLALQSYTGFSRFSAES